MLGSPSGKKVGIFQMLIIFKDTTNTNTQQACDAETPLINTPHEEQHASKQYCSCSTNFLC